MFSAMQIGALLCVLSVVNAATIYTKPAGKRAVDSYNYPLPVVTFSDASNQQKKTIVETMKSVSPSGSQGRYLPPSPTASSATGTKSPPISVSFDAYEAPAAVAKPASTAAPIDITSAPPTVQKKRPSGGLGGFKYYGGSGSSSSASNSNAAAAAAVPSTSAPAPVKTESAPAPKQVQKPLGYDYPSPKSIRKPSKKEQKLADSKPEESAQGYHYDVGPAAIAASSVLSGSNSYSGGSSGAMMGLSYMRQSSPFYSYHVMLD